MLKRLKSYLNQRRKPVSNPEPELVITTERDEERTLLLIKSGVQRSVEPIIGETVLQIAEMHQVEWSSFCKRGTCARCRCIILEGEELLSSPNEAEEARLDPEELEEGYRLGCQAKVKQPGDMTIRHTPYF
ncbi:(2Fe-2S)-binding protein [Paenibacillus sp. F411]|uniref:2Fe-2S iron-sulfur cluster-binding protein n=1 Tax=Paenibacillus sp. F411 TaxID=2820239 RepID=UPI001AAFDD84|nr:(2Fe-2S)-binding protein [Paenibacillus sp. F411]